MVATVSANRINMPFGKDDEDDSPAQKRAPFKRDRKDFLMRRRCRVRI